MIEYLPLFKLGLELTVIPAIIIVYNLYRKLIAVESDLKHVITRVEVKEMMNDHFDQVKEKLEDKIVPLLKEIDRSYTRMNIIDASVDKKLKEVNDQMTQLLLKATEMQLKLSEVLAKQ